MKKVMFLSLLALMSTSMFAGIYPLNCVLYDEQEDEIGTAIEFGRYYSHYSVDVDVDYFSTSYLQHGSWIKLYIAQVGDPAIGGNEYLALEDGDYRDRDYEFGVPMQFSSEHDLYYYKLTYHLERDASAWASLYVY